MVAPVNEFDTRLQAEPVRTLAPRGGLILSATANLVTVAGGVGTPSIITLVATPLVVAGSVVFSTSPSVPLTLDTTGLIATLHYADMGTSSVVVTATLTANGIPYADSRTISQVSIGSLGYQGALDATRNNTAQGALSARPAGADGDFYFATDTLVLYQKVAGAWRAAGNNFTNTSQLIDGANLGQTAAWPSVAGRPADDQIRNNLTDLAWWKRLATSPWASNGEYNVIAESLPDYGIMGPKGQSEAVWLCEEQTNDGGPGGGWNYAPLTLDPTKTYRFVIPIRRVSGTGSAYWGIMEGNVANLNGTINGSLNPGGVQDAYSNTEVAWNPYFANIGNLPSDRWHLFIGYVYPAGSTGNTHDSAGVWDCMTGKKIANGLSFNSRAGITQVQHRAYQYYASNGARQAFGRPMVNLVDGTEPSLRDYFGGAVLGQNVGGSINDTNAPSLVTVSSASKLTTYLGTFRTGTSGARSELSDGGLKVVSSSGAIIRAGSTAL